MSKEKQIEVITYEQDRLNYFTDLMQKSQKKYKRLFKRFKDAPYLSDESQRVSDAGREAHFFGDVVEMLEKGYRKQSEGEWIVTDADSGSFGEYEPFIEFKCPKCESVYGIESGQYDWQYGEPIPWVACPLCGAKMKGGAE